MSDYLFIYLHPLSPRYLQTQLFWLGVRMAIHPSYSLVVWGLVTSVQLGHPYSLKYSWVCIKRHFTQATRLFLNSGAAFFLGIAFLSLSSALCCVLLFLSSFLFLCFFCCCCWCFFKNYFHKLKNVSFFNL